MTVTAQPPNPAPVFRRDALRDELLGTVDLLKKCRAADVKAGYIDDYVALNWLEWNGGSLRLTVTGQNVCSQLKAGIA
jgi:hypothetical protein